MLRRIAKKLVRIGKKQSLALHVTVVKTGAVLLPLWLRQQLPAPLRTIIKNTRSGTLLPLVQAQRHSGALRAWVKKQAGIADAPDGQETVADLLTEIAFLKTHQRRLKPVFKALASKRVLYSGQAYYNAWYLSRALRDIGWQSHLLNWDASPTAQIYYHGEDTKFTVDASYDLERDLRFYVAAIYAYDVFHFSNKEGICFGFPVQNWFKEKFYKYAEIHLLKALGKIIVYSNNGCLDGVSQTSFRAWSDGAVCGICRWRDVPSVCSDARNLAWGKFRNAVADYQCLLGGNRVDYNAARTVHETPEFYCLDPEIWNPSLAIPQQFRLPAQPDGTVWLYHAVGNKAERTTEDGVNIKSTHIYQPLVEKLKRENLPIALLEPTGIPNLDLRYMQVQVDIFLDMLTYGWFGANVREAMMLGKVVICYIRPEWLTSLRAEIPEYADTLPIVSATPETVEEILRDLIANPEKRRTIGHRSREFALKWHSSPIAAQRFDEIYSKLLTGDPLWLEQYA